MSVTTQEIQAAVEQYGNKSAAAQALGITRNALRWRLENVKVSETVEQHRQDEHHALRSALQPPRLVVDVPAFKVAAPGRVKWLAFSCPHCPLQDDEAVEFVVQQIEWHRPDVVVHLGDGHEMASAARWNNEERFGLASEFTAHLALLRKIRQAAGDARLIFLPGNHDANLLAVDRIDPRYRGLLDYRYWEGAELRHWEQPCEYVYDRDRGAVRLGQVTFSHGYECNQSSDEMQSITLGNPYGLFVSGHTHRPLPVTQAGKTKAVPLPYWYANAGTIRDIVDSAVYMTRKRRHLWGQAVVIGDCYVPPAGEPLPMERQWDAETVVFRMFNEVAKEREPMPSDFGTPEELLELLEMREGCEA
jgi:predicted phosphodiesterase